MDYSQLSKSLEGELKSDTISKLMLATDASIYSVMPAAVVYPANQDDVIQTLRFASKHGLSVHSRGSGSGLCGSAVGPGLVLDFSRFMNRLLDLDLKKKSFSCEPGYRFGELEKELIGSGLFFPPDPSSGEYASFGGMLATNASGAHSVKYGNVSDYLVDAEFILADGSVHTLQEISNLAYDELPQSMQKLFLIYIENQKLIEKSYPSVRYNVAGYNLRNMVRQDRLFPGRLLAGSEGTLAVVTRLNFALREKPIYDSLVVAYFDDIVSSSKAVQAIMPLGPAGIEIMDKSLLNLARDSDPVLREKIPGDIDNVLLIEFDSNDQNEAVELAGKAQQLSRSQNSFLAVQNEEKEKFWAIRKAAVPILYKLKGEKKILALIEDAVVPIDKLAAYFKGTYTLLEKHGVDFVVYGHIAKGLMHTRPLLNLKEKRDISLLKTLADAFFELIYGLGGVVSGEHGDGRLRSSYIPSQYPDIYPLFGQIKESLDPQNILNPEIKNGNDSLLVQKFLRYGADYKAKAENLGKTNSLQWPEGLNEAIETCHGCSKCTTVTTATRMCPVYKFTRIEEASPKAKANVLRSLISGQIKSRELYSKTFQQVMQHCVSCGSCYVECPSNVNIPKMAQEARSHYLKKFGVPLNYHLLTNAELAGRNLRKFSAIMNFPLQARFLRKLGEPFTGIAANRKVPSFAFRSLRERLHRDLQKQPSQNPQDEPDKLKVLYFAGCYASYIRPEIGEAANQVLYALGISVETPEQHCCGQPMLSKGMIKAAKRKVRQNQKDWGDLIDQVDHIVVTCSSCGLSLQQEWSYLEESDFTRKVKEKTIHISALIQMKEKRLNELMLTKQKNGLSGRHVSDNGNSEHGKNSMKLAYHMPCHLKVQKDSQSSLQLLSTLPDTEVDNMESHCCGIAGSWGMAAKHYPLSMKIGSDLAAKLDASDAKIAVTDCPTCRMQMEHLSHKLVYHPIEVLAEKLAKIF